MKTNANILTLIVATFGTSLAACNGPGSHHADLLPLKDHTGPVSDQQVLEVARSIDEFSIRTMIEHLTGEEPAPLDSGDVKISERGSQSGRYAAAQYMKESFEDMGYPTRILTFTSSSGSRGYNVEATLEGQPGGGHLWVTAHLDSVHNAGASDDASGLASVLMTARALQGSKPRHTVHFVAYDLEEIGLVGSLDYFNDEVAPIVNKKGEQAILGNIQSDMIGWDEGQNQAVIGSCNQGGTLPDTLLDAARLVRSPLSIRDDCLGRSDHKRFWDQGLPAVILTDSGMYDAYPWYHKIGDTIDKLNLPYLQAMVQATAAAVTQLAFETKNS